VEAAQALADLLEISPQVEAATVFDDHDEPLGSVGVSAWWALAAVRAGRALLEDAADLRGDDSGEATQVHASLADGDVFVVGSPGGETILAVTSARQPAGQLFYDLKRCLDSISEAQTDSEPGVEG